MHGGRDLGDAGGAVVADALDVAGDEGVATVLLLDLAGDEVRANSRSASSSSLLAKHL